MATRTREQYLENQQCPKAYQAVTEPKRTSERTKGRKAGLASNIAGEVRRGCLELQMFLSSFLPPYGPAFRHPRSLSAREKAEREMDLLVF
jgi:hypothetical protein